MIQKDNIFGEWVFKTRRGKGWTQQELANKLNCSKSYISNVERGVSTRKDDSTSLPDPDTIDNFAAVLGADANEPRKMLGYAPKEADPNATVIYAKDGAVQVVGAGFSKQSIMQTIAELREMSQQLLAASANVDRVAQQLSALQ